MVIVGYGRCFADRQNLMVCLRSMPNVFTGSCARMRCCLSENLLYRHRNRHIQAEYAERKQSAMVLTGLSSAVITERLRVTFALDCCDREALHWAVTTGGFNSETVQDVMLGAVERRFGNDLPSSPVEWLTDNGSCYRANETRQFARMLGLEPKNTAVRSPESNGIAESFVKTIKRDYISIMPKPDGLTAAKNLAEAFEHYNEWHPHSALGYRSPREYLRQRACNGLSDNRCLEI